MAPHQQPAWHTSVWQRAKQKQALLLSLLLFCVTGVAANITFKLELNAMPNLPVFVAQLNPIVFTLVFAPVYAYCMCGLLAAPPPPRLPSHANQTQLCGNFIHICVLTDAWRQSHSTRGNTTTTAVQPVVAMESQPLITADSRHGAGSVNNGTSPEASPAAAGVAMEEEEHQQHLLPQSTTRGWRNAVLLQVACISMLDVTANVIEIVSSMGLGTHAGAISLLLGQSVLPFTVVMSLLILHRRCVCMRFGESLCECSYPGVGDAERPLCVIPRSQIPVGSACGRCCCATWRGCDALAAPVGLEPAQQQPFYRHVKYRHTRAHLVRAALHCHGSAACHKQGAVQPVVVCVCVCDV